MVRHILATILLFSFGSSAIAAKPPILTVREEILQHRARVLKHSLIMYQEHPELFPTLGQLPKETAIRLLTAYISLHDAPKTMTKHQLDKLGYQGDKSILMQLYGIWGEHVEPKPAFIDDLNKIESDMKQKEMEIQLADIDPRLHNGILHEIETLELSADITDTKIFRGHELGFKRKAYSAEKFLIDKGQFTAAILSKLYEQKYYPMTVNSCKAVYR